MKKINRPVSYEDRVFDILKSIREPWLKVKTLQRGVPSITVEFGAAGGVCIYRYQHSGLIGMNSFIERIEKVKEEIQ